MLISIKTNAMHCKNHELICETELLETQNHFNHCYKNKSLFFDDWFENNLLLVGQLFNSVRRLYNYSDFLQKYNVPVSADEYAVVFNAIPSGVSFLFQYTFPWPCTLHLHLCI